MKNSECDMSGWNIGRGRIPDVRCPGGMATGRIPIAKHPDGMGDEEIRMRDVRVEWRREEFRLQDIRMEWAMKNSGCDMFGWNGRNPRGENVRETEGKQRSKGIEIGTEKGAF